MKLNLLLCHFFGLLVILVVGSAPKTYSPKPTKAPYNSLEPSKTPLLKASLTGEKSGVSRRFKTILAKIHCLHLLTPSGLHISCILALFFKFFKSRKAHLIVIFLITITSWALPELYSLKRVTAYNSLRSFGRLPPQTAFWCTFALDLILGPFTLSPLSSAYSLIFWGTLFFGGERFSIKLLYLFVLNCLLSSLTSKTPYLLSLLLGPLTTSIFTLAFPIILFLSLVNLLIPWTGFILLFFETTFVKYLISIESQNLISLPTVSALYFLILSVLYFPSLLTSSKIVLISLLLLPTPLENLEKKTLAVPTIINRPNGETFRACKKKFRGSFYEIQCR